MTDGGRPSPDPQPSEWDVGGLHFAVSFRAPAGATFRLSGPVKGTRQELIRFDDFVDSPHYHAPADADPVLFDRASLGEPLDWLVHQMSDHLEEFLTSAGFESVLPMVDTQAVADSAERIRATMTDCVPEGFVRVPGIGLQRDAAGSAAEGSALRG
jgi:hypothetical protein